MLHFMALGFYFHTPYCIQRCSYCDFATYEKGTVPGPEIYFPALMNELHAKQQLVSPQMLTSVYFGGGTPSLIEAHYLTNILKKLRLYGFGINENTEITIEINPATVSEEKLNVYLENGINRFSVGAQTFNDRLLKSVRREHSAADTRKTLALLEKYNLNYSFDVLFALPNQSLNELKEDLKELGDFQPRHISPYCLTVPETHPLAKNRAPEDDQIEMFNLLHESLSQYGFEQYEISNYAQPGYESKHNLLYWQDKSYLGVGLSAHSYLNVDWGTRFWNKSNLKEYLIDYQSTPVHLTLASMEESLKEDLSKAQSLTDFCHTSLRLNLGLNLEQVKDKFGANIQSFIRQKLTHPKLEKLVERHPNMTQESYRLSRQGQFISNYIFEFFTFLKADLDGL